VDRPFVAALTRIHRSPLPPPTDRFPRDPERRESIRPSPRQSFDHAAPAIRRVMKGVSVEFDGTSSISPTTKFRRRERILNRLACKEIDWNRRLPRTTISDFYQTVQGVPPPSLCGPRRRCVRPSPGEHPEASGNAVSAQSVLIFPCNRGAPGSVPGRQYVDVPSSEPRVRPSSVHAGFPQAHSNACPCAPLYGGAERTRGEEIHQDPERSRPASVGFGGGAGVGIRVTNVSRPRSRRSALSRAYARRWSTITCMRVRRPLR
jgi:hypothetical protein